MKGKIHPESESNLFSASPLPSLPHPKSPSSHLDLCNNLPTALPAPVPPCRYILSREIRGILFKQKSAQATPPLRTLCGSPFHWEHTRESFQMPPSSCVTWTPVTAPTSCATTGPFTRYEAAIWSPCYFSDTPGLSRHALDLVFLLSNRHSHWMTGGLALHLYDLANLSSAQ